MKITEYIAGPVAGAFFDAEMEEERCIRQCFP